MPEWMPELITLADHGGDWDRYLAATYDQFRADFIGVALEFKGLPVKLKRHPITAGKEATFWHFVSDGRVEDERLPNFRRFERIAWPRAIIDNQDCPSLKIWTEDVRGDQRIHVLCEEVNYLFVLADRDTYVLPWTAYPIENANQIAKLLKRWRQNGGA